MTNNLAMRWIPVADATGRTHLESVWVTLDEAPPVVLPAARASAEGTENAGATHAA